MKSQKSAFELTVMKFVSAAIPYIMTNRGRVIMFTKKKIHRLAGEKVNNHAAAYISRKLCEKSNFCEVGERGGKVKIVIENSKCIEVLANILYKLLSKSTENSLSLLVVSKFLALLIS